MLKDFTQIRHIWKKLEVAFQILTHLGLCLGIVMVLFTDPCGANHFRCVRSTHQEDNTREWRRP